MNIIIDIFILDKSCPKSLKFHKNSRTLPGAEKIPGLFNVLGKIAKFLDFKIGADKIPGLFNVLGKLQNSWTSK